MLARQRHVFLVAREPSQMTDACGPFLQNLDTSDSRIDLPGFLNRPLRTLEARSGKVGVVTNVTEVNDIADNPIKATIRDSSGNPYAFVLCSQPQYPSLVARGVTQTETIRALLGRELGAVLIRPLLAGAVNGVSYAILPWHRPMPASGLGRYLARTRIRRKVLSWLRRANQAAVATHLKNDASANFKYVLQRLRTFQELDVELRDAVDFSLGRLQNGDWCPKHTFDHNDLSIDNLVLPATHRNPQDQGFVIIDWAGATVRGFGIYDLVRLCRSAAIPTRILAHELRSHCDILQCNLVDAKGHLLACLGNLYLSLECFSEEQFGKLLDSSWRTLLSALYKSNKYSLKRVILHMYSAPSL